MIIHTDAKIKPHTKSQDDFICKKHHIKIIEMPYAIIEIHVNIIQPEMRSAKTTLVIPVISANFIRNSKGIASVTMPTK